MTINFETAKTWMKKLGGALLDQAFFVSSNFLLNVLLARWMTIEQYGFFVVVYVWFLLVQNIYESTVIEPMNIFGAGKYFKHLQKYFGYIFYGHLWFTLLLSLIVSAIALLVFQFSTIQVAQMTLVMALCLPFLLTRSLTRQPFYITSQPHLAALGGFLYLVISLIIVALLQTTGYLNSMTALLAMAVSGFLASLIQTLLFIKPEWRINQPQDEIMGKKILLDHWSYGRWSVLSRTMVWAQININYIVLPLIMSVAMSAALRATLNLVMPVFMAISSTMTIILPYFVRSYTERGRSQLNRLVILVLTGYLTVAFLLGVLVIFFGQWAINYLYNGKFDEFVTFKYVFAIAILPALAAASTTMNAALLAVGGVKRSFFAKIIPLILSLTLGIYLLWQFGLIGAPIGAIIVQLVTIGLVCYEYQNFNEEKAII